MVKYYPKKDCDSDCDSDCDCDCCCGKYPNQVQPNNPPYHPVSHTMPAASIEQYDYLINFDIMFAPRSSSMIDIDNED
jgi:hypothetical protein